MADSKQIWAPTTDDDDESFFVAPLGTPLPTDAVDELDEDFEGCGWMGEDGFRNNIARDTEKKRAFSGQVVKVVQNSYDETIQVTFYERSPIVLKTVFGHGNVSVSYTGGHRKTVVRHDDAQLPRQSYVIRTVEGVKTSMLVVPEGQITEVDEIQIVHNELWMYTCTIDCYKPESGSQPDNPAGVNEYIDEPDEVDGS